MEDLQLIKVLAKSSLFVIWRNWESEVNNLE